MPNDALLATYYIESTEGLASVAEHVAELESTGKWQGAGEPTALFQECRGEVAEVNEQEPGKGYATIRFPLKNFNLEEGAFASLWLTMIGGGTHALTAYQKSRLVDFRLPDSALAAFPGPQFGIDRTRKILDMQPGEPIVGTIVKPTSGLTPRQVADMCYEFAAGGCRFIKDDEKMLSAAYCPLAERVRLVVEALRRAEQDTGERVLYCPHVTTSAYKIRDYACIARDNGANGLMLNFFAAGFQALEMLARDSELGLPIYAHCGGKEALGRAPGQGVSPEVIARFARLMGGDYFRTGVLGGYLVGGTEPELRSLTSVLVEPMRGIGDTVPVLSGGLDAGNVGRNVRAFGREVMLLAGTGVTGHPGGIRAGVDALKAAAMGA